MKDPALEICPKDHCGQKRWGRGRVRRQLGTGAGLIFKGSGFYITDYRSEGYKEAAKKESESKSPSAKPADSSKTAAPAPSTPTPSKTASTSSKAGSAKATPS